MAVHHDKLTVLVPKFGIEGTIYLSDEEEKGQLEYDETQVREGGVGSKIRLGSRFWAGSEFDNNPSTTPSRSCT